MELLNDTIDNKSISYTNETRFLVQVGRGAKGGYSTKYAFTGKLRAAVLYYNSVNVGNGYKKRLYAPALVNPVLAKQTS